MEKNKMMMIVIIILLVVLLGTIVGIAFYVVKEMRKDPVEIIITPAPVVEVTWDDLVTFSVGEITRNLLSEGNANHVLKATYSFEINSAQDTEGEFLALLNSKIDVVRDIINSIVGNATYTEVRSANGMDYLKEQILNKAREVFQTNLIWEVNISSFVYQ